MLAIDGSFFVVVVVVEREGNDKSLSCVLAFLLVSLHFVVFYCYKKKKKKPIWKKLCLTLIHCMAVKETKYVLLLI